MGASTHQAISCHTASHTSTAHRGMRGLALVVEGFIRQGAAYRGGVLVIEHLKIARQRLGHFLTINIDDGALGEGDLGHLLGDDVVLADERGRLIHVFVGIGYGLLIGIQEVAHGLRIFVDEGAAGNHHAGDEHAGRVAAFLVPWPIRR